MKHCAKCFKEYDDAWKVCLDDSSPLVEGKSASPYLQAPPLTVKEIIKETYRITWYIKLFPIALALLLGAFLMWGEVKKIYKENNVLKTILSHQGSLFLLVLAGFVIIVSMILKYRKLK